MDGWQTVSVFVVLFAIVNSDILKFIPRQTDYHHDVNKIEDTSFNLLKHILDFSNYQKVEQFPDITNAIHSGSIKDGSTGRLGKYAFMNCKKDTSKDLFVINHLTVTPDPLILPGGITVDFQGTARKAITKPVKANVTLRNVAVGVDMPCIADIGSCVYEDLCALLDQITTCPPQLVAAGIPCACPISSGNYSLKNVMFDVEASFLPTGTFMIQGNLTKLPESVGCYKIFVTFDCK